MSEIESNRCPVCGRSLASPTSFGGVCPQCLLRSGRESLHSSSSVVHDETGAEIESYHLEAKIGEGGFGVVYRARQTEPVRRTVAFKLIKPGMDTSEVVRRFEAERQALAMMDHPNVATVFDGGSTPDGRPFFVMELVDGEPITTSCDRHRLTVSERIKLFMQVCAAVQHAHQKGIVHRDLKPSNVLVARDEREIRVKVIDFGIAKAIDQEAAEQTVFTSEGRMVGTPQYMSPEQTGGRNADIDTRSDVYSLGILLYELLTGFTPLDPEALRSAGYAEMERLICERDPPTPSTRISTMAGPAAQAAGRRSTDTARLARSLRGDLDWIVLTSLAKERDRRYQTVAAFSADLRHYLSNEPVSARPPSTAYQLGKFARRHRGPLAALAAIIIVLIAGIVATTTQAIRARRAQAESERQRYAAEMNLAGRSVRRPEGSARIQELVSHWTDSELRGWEWYFLDSVSEQSVAVDETHAGGVLSLAWSPDETMLVCGRADGTLHLWDPDRPGRATVLGHQPGAVPALAWHPERDQIASPGSDGVVRLWRPDPGTQPLEIPVVGRPVLASVAWHPDHDWLAVGGTGRLVVLQVPSGEILQDFGVPPRADVRSIAWTADGKRLSAAWLQIGGAGSRFSPVFQELTSWDAQTGEKTEAHSISAGVITMLAERNRTHREVAAWSPLGERVAFPVRQQRTRDAEDQPATGRHTLRILKAGDDAPGASLDGIVGMIESLHWHPEQSLLATAGMDHGVSIWSLNEEGSGSFKLTQRGHTNRVNVVRWSPTGKRIASGGADGTVRIWDPRGCPAIRPYWEPEGVNQAGGRTGSFLAWSPEGTHLAAVGAGVFDDVYLWDRRTGNPTLEIRDESHLAHRASWHPNGRELATGGFEGQIRIWSLPTRAGEMENRQFLPSALPEHRTKWIPGGRVTELSYSPNGEHLASGSSDGVVHVWNPQSGELIRSFTGHSGHVEQLGWHPDGGRLVSAGRDGTARIWDLTEGDGLVFAAHSGAVFGVAWHPDGHQIASIGQSGTIHIWDAETGEKIRVLRGHTAPARGIAWNPDGSRLASGGQDHTVRIWKPDDGSELLALEWDGLQSARSVEWSPDGQVLALGLQFGGVLTLDASASYARNP